VNSFEVAQEMVQKWYFTKMVMKLWVP